MGRLLFLAAIAAIIYWLFWSPRERLPKNGKRGEIEDMVRCAQCGIHLPKSESLFADGKYYCGESHRRLFAETVRKG